jgi:hypothetical protein
MTCEGIARTELRASGWSSRPAQLLRHLPREGEGAAAIHTDHPHPRGSAREGQALSGIAHLSLGASWRGATLPPSSPPAPVDASYFSLDTRQHVEY